MDPHSRYLVTVAEGKVKVQVFRTASVKRTSVRSVSAPKKAVRAKTAVRIPPAPKPVHKKKAAEPKTIHTVKAAEPKTDAKKTAKPRVRKAKKEDDWAVRERERAEWQSEYDRYRDILDKTDDPHYTEDMRAYLDDNAYDEIAPSSYYKRSEKHAAKAYNKMMRDEQRMHAMDDAYRHEAAMIYGRKAGKKGRKK